MGCPCTAALACFLIDKGYTVLYECGSDNEASIALAKKLGGIQSGKNFCIVGHRISELNSPDGCAKSTSEFARGEFRP